MKKNNKVILVFFLFIISCRNNTGSRDNANTTRNNTDSIVENEFYEGEGEGEGEGLVMKEINWTDGNTYMYTETETLRFEDSLGNEKNITVYKTAPPAESIMNCEIKRCKWCGREENARGITVREYPNLDALRGSATYSDLLELASVIFMNSNEGMSFLSMMMGNKSINAYFDLENNKIRTEWKTECHYNGPSDFCSLKCENEYNNR
jgi:hypothetical protein